jgi:LPXTG-motif cell wall-anchored protein
MNYGSLRQDVRRLSDQGRFGDSMMMHVNPIEVAALDSMVPGGLTRNPATGQPEAWLPLLGLALGATIGGATAKKRKQGLLEGILMGGGLGLMGGMGAGALAGGAGAAGAAGATTAAGTAGTQAGALSASQIAASKAAAAAAGKTAAAGAAKTGAAASGSIAPNVGSLFGQEAIKANVASAMAPGQGVLLPPQSIAPNVGSLFGQEAIKANVASAMAPGQGVLAPQVASGSQAGSSLLQQGLGAGPGGVPYSSEAINNAKIVMNQANPNVFHGARPDPSSPDMIRGGFGELFQGRGGEAFMRGVGDTLKGYGGNLKEGLGVMADNPMMTMGGAMMLDRVLNDEEEEEYGEYDGPLAYGSWRHGGAG